MSYPVRPNPLLPGLVEVDLPKCPDGDAVSLDYYTFHNVLDVALNLTRRWINPPSEAGAIASWMKNNFQRPIVLADATYVAKRIPLGQIYHDWEEFIEKMGLRYISEVFDCDDWSSMFSSWAAAKYKTNTFVRLWGALCFKDEGCYGHGFNVIVLYTGCGPSLVNKGMYTVFLWVLGFEPQINASATLNQDGTFDIKLTDTYSIHYIPMVAMAW